MKKYNLVLQGANLVIDELERQYIFNEENKAIRANEKDFVINLGGNRFKKSMIKGIFEIKQEHIESKEHFEEKNGEWVNQCRNMAGRSAEDKTISEIDNRILNLLRHDEAVVLDDMEMAVIHANIKQFFIDNPKYPRCPSRIWWPFISEKVKGSIKLAHDGSIYKKWWYLVNRNDTAIAEYIKYT